MIQTLLDWTVNLAVGLVVGALFFLIKLPVPAPPVLSAVFAIMGMTLGYMIMTKLLGS